VTMLDDLRRWSQVIAEAPPSPRAMLMHHSVPYGRLFRQWNTRGDLYVWVNPGVIHDLPRRKADHRVGDMLSASLSGIPVVDASSREQSSDG
jgi:hypothetical protein